MRFYVVLRLFTLYFVKLLLFASVVGTQFAKLVVTIEIYQRIRVSFFTDFSLPSLSCSPKACLQNLSILIFTFFHSFVRNPVEEGVLLILISDFALHL
jgi:hypothetical protein